MEGAVGGVRAVACAACGEAKPETQFSKRQSKRGSEARCVACCASQGSSEVSGNGPAGAKRSKTSTAPTKRSKTSIAPSAKRARETSSNTHSGSGGRGGGSRSGAAEQEDGDSVGRGGGSRSGGAEQEDGEAFSDEDPPDPLTAMPVRTCTSSFACSSPPFF
jgi:hypothetical protein